MGTDRQPERRWLAGCLIFGGWGLFWAYLLSPPYVREVLCPAGTFAFGSIGSETGVLGVLLVFPAFSALAICATPKLPENTVRELRRGATLASIRNYPVVVSALALAAIGASVMLWASVTFSFYCVTPSAIFLHPDVGKPYRKFSWDDVQVVQGHCWAGSRTPWQGGVNVIMYDGEKFLYEFGSGRGVRGPEHLKQNYERIRSALEGKEYRYDGSDINNCPLNVYPFLQAGSWPHNRNPFWPSQIR